MAFAKTISKTIKTHVMLKCKKMQNIISRKLERWPAKKKQPHQNIHFFEILRSLCILCWYVEEFMLGCFWAPLCMPLVAHHWGHAGCYIRAMNYHWSLLRYPHAEYWSLCAQEASGKKLNSYWKLWGSRHVIEKPLETDIRNLSDSDSERFQVPSQGIDYFS